MNSFPNHIRSDNISTFQKINFERVAGLFRKEVYETILTRKDENVYIDLDTFSRKYCNNKACVVEKFLTSIIEELAELGWKTKLSFGDTGLFIYSTEDPPSSCW